MKNVMAVLKSEKGSLQNLTWEVGAAVVIALVIVAAMVFAPETAQDFWDSATGWIRSQFGF